MLYVNIVQCLVCPSIYTGHTGINFFTGFINRLHAIAVNTGQIKSAVHFLEKGHFFDPIHEVMSNTRKIPQGLCTVWIITQLLHQTTAHI